MGCFSQTCGITGLPIEHQDKVRFALIAKPYGGHLHPETPAYACDTFQFITPLLRDRYDHYGLVEDRDDPVWSWLWQKIAPHALPTEKQHVYATDDPDELFGELVHNDRVYDPDRAKRAKYLEEGRPAWCIREPLQMWIWMCHEAAFNRLSIKDAGYLPEFLSKLDDQIEKLFDPNIFREFDYIEGSHSAFHSAFKYIIDVENLDLKDKVIPKIKQEIKKTCLFVSKLATIRTVIRPLSNNGSQHGDYASAIKWNQWVSDLARKMKKEHES